MLKNLHYITFLIYIKIFLNFKMLKIKKYLGSNEHLQRPDLSV